MDQSTQEMMVDGARMDQSMQEMMGQYLQTIGPIAIFLHVGVKARIFVVDQLLLLDSVQR